jgi:ribosomal protein S18 acetylase RimI-like enzyme
MLAAQATLYRSVNGGLFEVTPNWARGYSGINSPVFNVFFPLNGHSLDDEVLADTAAFFSSRDVIYSIELVHDRLPQGPDYLNERNYQPLPPQPAMALRDFAPPERLNGDVQVEPVRTVPALTAFWTLLNRVFDFDLADMRKLFPVAQLKIDSVQHYLAFADEQPVSAGTRVCVENVVSIWNLCTVDEYRQRGIATALLHQMLKDAYEAGCDLGMLYSTAQAYHLFNKFGFEIFTQRQWFLPPDIEYGD